MRNTITSDNKTIAQTRRLCSKCKVNEATSNGYCKPCNAERARGLRQPQETGQHDTSALASSLGIQLDPATAMLADSLTDTQALLLVERIFGKEVAQQKLKLLMEEGRLE